MTPVRPDVIPSGRYSIAKAARALGIGRSTLYHWYKRGVFLPTETGLHYYEHKGLYIFGSAILRIWDEQEIVDPSSEDGTLLVFK